jgi:hypothetical protein
MGEDAAASGVSAASAFDVAVAAVRAGADPVREAGKLYEELTEAERLGLLDGDTLFWEGLAEMRQARYGSRPYVHGAVARLGIPGIRFVDGPRGCVAGAGTAFYPHGFGLSYTTFAVEQATAGRLADRHIPVTARVRNTGARDGWHVVQVYGHRTEGERAGQSALLGFRRRRHPGRTHRRGGRDLLARPPVHLEPADPATRPAQRDRHRARGRRPRARSRRAEP